MNPRLPTLRQPGVPFQTIARFVAVAAGLLSVLACPAETTNAAAITLSSPSLPDTGVSFIRVMGALALVIGVFLGGVWLFRNWQRLTLQRGREPKLNVVEVRSLGGRHALYVVGYEQERFLLAASPAGVNLLTHLPPTEMAGEVPSIKSAPPSPSFAQALASVLKGK